MSKENSTAGLVVRPAKEADIEAVLYIYNDAILHTTAVYTYEAFTLPMMQQWYADKQAKGLPVLVADLNGAVAGFASYGPFRPWPAYQYTIEHSIYVHPDFRRQGIARELLSKLIEAAGEAGMHTIVAGIDSENEGSIRLHEAFGYKKSSRLEEVGYKFDRWLSLQFMQLLIKSPTHAA